MWFLFCFWIPSCSSFSGDCDFLRRLWQFSLVSSSSQAVCGWIFGDDGVLALKCFTSFLLHSHYIHVPLDQEWTKVIKTALYADLLCMLFLPLGWQTALLPFCRNVSLEHANCFQDSMLRSSEKSEITTSVPFFFNLYIKNFKLTYTPSILYILNNIYT